MTETQAPATRDRRARGEQLAGVVVVLLAAVLAYSAVIDLGFVGWDTYAVIDAAVVHGPGDLPGLLTRDFLGGYHETAHFMRPLTSATVALDYALHGLDAPGYHVTSLLLHAAASVAVCFLGWSWFGRGWGPVVGASLFALHPAHWDTVAYISQRGEVLTLLAGVCALLARERDRPALAAVLVLAATLSKETGAVFAALVLWRCLPDRRQLTRQALWLAGVVGPYLVYRLIAVGGTGGYILDQEGSEAFSWFVEGMVHMHLTGGSAAELPRGLASALPWIVFAAALPLTGSVCWRRGGLRRDWWTGGAATGLLAWLGLVVMHAVLVPEFMSWYSYLPLAFACTGLGGIVAAALRGLQAARTDAADRLTHALALGAAGCLLPLGIAWLLLVTSETNAARFRLATAAQEQFLTLVDEARATHPPGVVIRVRPAAVFLGPKRWNPDERGVLMVAYYTLSAWSHLTGADPPLVGVRTGETGSVQARDGVVPTTVEMYADSIPFTGETEARPPPMQVQVLTRER